MDCSSLNEIQDVVAENEEFHDKYKLQGLLGAGAYGVVFSAKQRESLDERAVKVISFSSLDPVEKPLRRSVTRLQSVLAEKLAWTKAGKHPNIVHLQEWYLDKFFAYFVMERCMCSLLHAWMKEPVLNEYTYANYFTDMVAALEHIHSVGVVHRDVKHDNFLVGGGDGCRVKLCDFGFSAVSTKDCELTGRCGSPAYMAPEVLAPQAAYGTASDVWSFGVIVYFSFFGAWPYLPKKMTASAMRKSIRDSTVPPSFAPIRKFRHKTVSDVALYFVRALLNRDPKTRPSAKDCLEMEYLLNKDIYAMLAAKRGLKKTSLSRLLESAFRSDALSVKLQRADPYCEFVLDVMQTRAAKRVTATSPVDETVKSTTPGMTICNQKSRTLLSL